MNIVSDCKAKKLEINKKNAGMGTKNKNKKMHDYSTDRNSADFPVSRCSVSGDV
jgi:hypothetical protein